MKKRNKRVLSILLSLATVMSFCSFTGISSKEKSAAVDRQEYYSDDKIPENIKNLVGVETDAAKTARSGTATDAAADSAAKFIKSDNLNEIVTLNSDGNGKAETFTVPVKYKDESGNTDFIDTAIVSNDLISSKLGGYEYKNAANKEKVQYSRSPEKGLKMGDAFTLSISGSQTAGDEPGYVSKESGNDDKLVYPDAFGSGTRVEYNNTYNGVKENILLESNTGKNTFEFIFQSESEDLALNADSTAICVVDKKDADKIDYVFSPLYVYDSYQVSGEGESAGSSSKHCTEDCHYEVTPVEDGKYLITAVVPEDFLSDPNVVYPVTVDPTIEYGNIPYYVDDTFAQSGVTDSTTYSWGYLRFGYQSGYINSYIKFNMNPTFPYNAIITYATLDLTYRPGQTTGNSTSVYRVNSSWTEQSLTVGNQPSKGAYLYSCSPNNFTNLYYNITTDMMHWYYHTGTNYGVMLTYSDASRSDYNSIYSSDCGDAAKAPRLIVEYSTTNATPGITNGQRYFIRNYWDGNYLDAEQDLNYNVIQYGFNGYTNQEWETVYQGNGYYKIYNMYPPYDGYCLDVTNYDADLYDATFPSDDLLFRIIPLGDGTYQIMDKGYGDYVLDVTQSGYPSDVVEQETGYDRLGQKWYFEAGTNTGGAASYRQVSTDTINCFGYALELNYWPHLEMNLNETVYTVYDRVYQYVRGTLGRECRQLDGEYSLVRPYEYKIAMRVGSHYGACDYHFMVQLNDGSWAEKHGKAPSIGPEYVDPSTISWDLDSYSNFYNSDTLYFAVTR